MASYLLMHRDIPVAELELDTVSGMISSVGNVFEPHHIPVGISVRHGVIDRGDLNSWWRGRAVPMTRQGIQDALLEMNLTDTQLLPEKCLGLSLSDSYWICPTGSDLSWGQVNFFENDFLGDVGSILFGKAVEGEAVSLMSPDNTSDGWLKKRWVILAGKRCLIKGGSGAFLQETYNEVLASRICERLHIPHVSYRLWTDQGRPHSLCEDFLTPDTELITAWYIMQTAKKPNHISVYRHYLNCCGRLEIPGVQEALDRMLVLDYLIVNEDRHQNNFGVIRRADTLDYVGAAPIYDSGTSLWFDTPTGLIQAAGKTACKPFKNTHEEQIRLVTDFGWLDFSALAGIDEELREIVRGSMFVDAARCDILCRALKRRVAMLEEAALSAQKSVFLDNTRFDVAEDAAYSGEGK